jgi:hypothetical protein
MIDKIFSALKNWKTIVTAIYALVITLALMSALYAWYGERNKPPVSQKVYIPVEQIKEVEKIKRVEVPGPEKIVTIEKKVLVEKLKIPDWFLDETEQAISTGVIAPYEGRTNVIATLNTETGAGNIIAKQIPLPFMQFENKKELGVRAGYTTDGAKAHTAIYGRWNFMRVGNVHLGLYGEANSEGAGIAQVDINYRF